MDGKEDVLEMVQKRIKEKNILRNRVKNMCKDLGCTVPILCKALDISRSTLTSMSNGEDGSLYKRFSVSVFTKIKALGINHKWIEDETGDMYLTSRNEVIKKLNGIEEPEFTPQPVDNIPADYKSPKWKSLVAEVALLDGYTCQVCGEDVRQLDCNYTAHHLRYNGEARYETEYKYLICCCNDCHKKLHDGDNLQIEVKDRPRSIIVIDFDGDTMKASMIRR